MGVVGVGLSIVGVALVVLDGLTSGHASLLGDLLVLVAAICVGAYAVLSMPLLERYTPLAVATYPVLFGIPFLLLLSSPELFSLDWGSVGAGPWAAVAYAGVFATAFTFSAWQRGISRIGANRVLVYQYLITIVGVTSGIVFFDETLSINKVAGGAVILLGVYLARRQ
jgi:drug/metabolite transporter (DMT)-like permease